MYIARGDMNNVSYYSNQINVGKVWINFSLRLVFKRKNKKNKKKQTSDIQFTIEI